MELDKECTQNPEEKVVVNERCYCGHLKSNHVLGRAKCDRCYCRRFAFVGWLFSDGTES